MTAFLSFTKTEETDITPIVNEFQQNEIIIFATETLEIPPDKTIEIDTKVKFKIPPFYTMTIRSIKELSENKGLYLVNNKQIINGEMKESFKVILYNSNNWLAREIKKGEPIARGIILPYPKVILSEKK